MWPPVQGDTSPSVPRPHAPGTAGREGPVVRHLPSDGGVSDAPPVISLNLLNNRMILLLIPGMDTEDLRALLINLRSQSSNGQLALKPRLSVPWRDS